MVSDKKGWIEVVKGIGIVVIVTGHIVSEPLRNILYVFHIPLFFFVSGYLYRQPANVSVYLRKKINTLLVPYGCFLVLFTAVLIIEASIIGNPPSVICSYLIDSLKGGRALTGWLSIFWFVTCLFLTQMLFPLLSKLDKFKKHLVMIVSLIASYINGYFYPELSMFWSVNTVLFSLPIFYMGHLFANLRLNFKSYQYMLTVTGFLPLYYYQHGWFIIDIKSAEYGMPIVAIFFSLSIVISIFWLAKKIVKFQRLASGLIYLGSASMLIMYLHQPIQITLKHVAGLESELFRTIVTLILCMYAYFIVSQNRLLCKYLLGRQ